MTTTPVPVTDEDPRGHNLERLFKVLNNRALRTSIMYDYDDRVRQYGHTVAMEKMTACVNRINNAT